MPSIVPESGAVEWPQYFVLCDYGPELGMAWAEIDPIKADRETILNWLVHGEFTDPVQVMEVNLPAGTCRDVSVEFAEAVRARSGGMSPRRPHHLSREWLDPDSRDFCP
jgi:hypothetical protein